MTYLVAGVEGLEGDGELLLVAVLGQPGCVVAAASHGPKRKQNTIEKKEKIRDVSETPNHSFNHKMI